MNLRLLCFESLETARGRQAKESARRLTCYLMILLALLIGLLLWQVDRTGGWLSIF